MTEKIIRDPILLALEIFTQIKREVRDENEGGDLRARSRDIPGLVEEIGLVPTLSFFYSKRFDRSGYRLMLKAILLYLQKIGIIPYSQSVDAMLGRSSQGTEEMIKLLEDLRKKSPAIVPVLRPFLIEFKRLCEATWEERGRL